MGVTNSETIPGHNNSKGISIGEDGLIYVSLSRTGLLIYDVLSPTEPHLIASHPSMSYNYEAIWHDEQLIVNNGGALGLYEMIIIDENPITNTDSLIFPETLVEELSEMELVISNPAREGLIRVIGLSIAGDAFNVHDRGRWLAPDEEWVVKVSFNPHEEGYFEGILQIEVDGGELIEVHLSGNSAVNSINKDDVSLPLKLELHPVYPNPFNSQTRISYFLPASGMVHLSIYDIKGREVGVLISEFQITGLHIISSEKLRLPTGLYIARLEAGDVALRTKMISLE